MQSLICVVKLLPVLIKLYKISYIFEIHIFSPSEIHCEGVRPFLLQFGIFQVILGKKYAYF